MNTMNKKSIVLCLALAVAAWSLPAHAQSYYSDMVMADNPLAFWEFEDASGSDGSPCADSTGARNATYRNTSTTIPDISLGPGKVGQAGHVLRHERR
jgi:hypothetical protein